MGEEGLRHNAMERVTRQFCWEQENRSENAAHIFLKYTSSTLFWQIHEKGRERLSALISFLENRICFNILETLKGGVGEGLQIILQLIKVTTWFADIEGSLDEIKEPVSLPFSLWPVLVSISVCPSFSGFFFSASAVFIANDFYCCKCASVRFYPLQFAAKSKLSDRNISWLRLIMIACCIILPQIN